jgi:hypothetical protein
MKKTLKHVAPWLAASAIGGAIALAPIASADTNPLVPYGPNPTSPVCARLRRGQTRRSRHHQRLSGCAVLISRRPKTGPSTS